MKNMKRIVTMALALLMLFALSACATDEEKQIRGSWMGTVDYTDYANQAITADTADSNLADYFQISDYKFNLVFTFEKNGTYRIDADEESIRNTINSVKEQRKESFRKYYEDIIKERSLGITVDQYLKDFMQTSLDQLVAESFGDDSELVAKFKADFNKSGDYKIKDGKLYLGLGDDGKVDETKYYTVKLSEKQIEFVNYSDGENAVFPLPFTVTLVK
ncbi:MAG: hypothetical protein PUD72_07695 [Oscillospiraceae bacterium]|nr:hypothetical protein [Oscillospiraceae bacterium]